jgi:hypothetical protein
MPLFDHTGDKLAAGPALLLPADPGAALLDAARLYDPQLRRWHGRLVFGNGVLLFGPVEVTPKLAGPARLPPGVAVAWYVRVSGGPSRDGRTNEAVRDDGELLVLGLAARLGGTLHPGPPRRHPALLASVYSEQPVPASEVAGILQQYAGAVAVEDVTADSYAVSGEHIGFYTAYWSPGVYRAAGAPPALGPLRKGPLHHWDLNTGMPPSRVRPELQLRLAEAALALAGRAGGIAVDMFGFRFDTPQQLVSVSERTPAP